MSGGTSVIKYTRVKSNALAPVSLDPVLQHMSAWHLRQHYRLVNNARSRELAHVNPGRCNHNVRGKQDVIDSSQAYSAPVSQTHPRLNKTTSQQNLKYNSTVNDPKRHTPQLASKGFHPRGHNIHWQAHEASHARQLADKESQPLFHPRILETKVNSCLLQSRNYQQPRRNNRNRPASGFFKDHQAVAPKPWLVPSSSSSSSGDSAYEAGGSSPPSRGSTPRNLEQISHHSCSKSNSSTSSQSQSPSAWESPVLSHTSPEPPKWDQEKQLPRSETSIRPSSVQQSLVRNEQLEYAMFEHDLMNEILSVGLLTNAAVKHACRAHILAHSDKLQKDKMEEIVIHLQQIMDIPNDDNMDEVCFGMGSARHSHERENRAETNAKTSAVSSDLNESPQICELEESSVLNSTEHTLLVADTGGSSQGCIDDS